MHMYDIIQKKKEKGVLSKAEIDFVINGLMRDEIADYQISALLMAICLNGMTAEETADLTLAMVQSGSVADLSPISEIKVDKHSTGGVGDKTTLITAPIVASLGVPVAKMAGRGLGHTGGTIDKLESVPGLRTQFSYNEFLKLVKETGICVASQYGSLAPADKKIYAIRDATATVDSIPLIASSVMSKKIAAGADCILLDVKTGNGAFMKTIDDSICLAQTMVDIGKKAGKKAIALITDMNKPLGFAIGNSLEVIEACETLKGIGPKDLTDLSIELAAYMLFLAGKGSLEGCRSMARDALYSGRALSKLAQMVDAQGGDSAYIKNPKLFKTTQFSMPIRANQSGYVHEMDCSLFGRASSILGAGRDNLESDIDYAAGIILHKKTGDYANEKDTLAVMYSSDEKKLLEAKSILESAFALSPQKPPSTPLIYKVIS
ncbi:MAG: thymidine phosphorylase [Clostridia bacterium]|nr:thymidine phosphorylase [Clostridia bacterium]